MGLQRKVSQSTKNSVTLAEAYQMYMQAKKTANLSSDSLRNIRDSIKRWMGFLTEKEYPLYTKHVTESYVTNFVNSCQKNGMKVSTLNHYLRDIKTFLYWCMEKGWVKEFKVNTIKEEEPIKETYTIEELRKLLARPAVNDSFCDWRTWAIINWVLATGNRASTICGVKIGDLNFDENELINHLYKIKKDMIMPLSPALKKVLMDYIRMWRDESTDEAYLFPNVGDERLTVNALKLSVRRYNESRDVCRTSIHAFRHTFAKNWIRNGGNVFKLQKLLGHSTLETTKKYVAMFAEDLKEDFEEYSPLDVIKKKYSKEHRVTKAIK